MGKHQSGARISFCATSKTSFSKITNLANPTPLEIVLFDVGGDFCFQIAAVWRTNHLPDRSILKSSRGYAEQGAASQLPVFVHVDLGDFELPSWRPPVIQHWR